MAPIPKKDVVERLLMMHQTGDLSLPKEILERAAAYRAGGNRDAIRKALSEFPLDTLKDLAKDKVEFVQVWSWPEHVGSDLVATLNVPDRAQGRLRLAHFQQDWLNEDKTREGMSSYEAAEAFVQWLEEKHKFTKVEVLTFGFHDPS